MKTPPTAERKAVNRKAVKNGNQAGIANGHIAALPWAVKTPPTAEDTAHGFEMHLQPVNQSILIIFILDS
ncbi:MAG: hypothetical protein KGM16_03675 [Bacteroidota bacterium]|nr:hypothetical protein [Bacteroidota bacterium]